MMMLILGFIIFHIPYNSQKCHHLERTSSVMRFTYQTFYYYKIGSYMHQVHGTPVFGYFEMLIWQIGVLV